MLLGGIAIAADDDLPYMASIAIERAPGEVNAFGPTLQSVLHVNDASKTAHFLSNVDGLEVVASDEDTVTVQYIEKPTVVGDPAGQYERSTWVVDFTEEAVQELVDDLAAGLEATPSIDELERYVYEFITNKTYSRAFDLASQVAASGEGDCTEHAVLLAALARANGFQARVTFGNLIIDTDAGLFAFGHAWTEVYDGEQWQITDATLPGRDPTAKQLRYLPAAILADEGPGYVLSVFEAVSTMPIRISGVANP
jgi:transglutaminase-like putative cysteine protease